MEDIKCKRQKWCKWTWVQRKDRSGANGHGYREQTEVVQMDMGTETKRRKINHYFLLFLLLSKTLFHVNVVLIVT